MSTRQVHLKIKIKHLSSESRIIRHEEQKSLTHARNAKASGNVDFFNNHRSTFNSLRRHRVGPVRRYARLNNLAYGFLRSTPYQDMEHKVRDYERWPNFLEIGKLAKRFKAKGMTPNEFDQLFRAWKHSAEIYLESQF